MSNANKNHMSNTLVNFSCTSMKHLLCLHNVISFQIMSFMVLSILAAAIFVLPLLVFSSLALSLHGGREHYAYRVGTGKTTF